ncbi:MAG: hypothetical protein HY377_00570, partial [Candidatus Blackburnbacteria bacterium]|nr:hypothetical protein [Candidatus Blackburnbacteria bacterium]
MIKPVGSLSYIWLLLGSAFILRVLLAPFGTLLLDHNTFVAWSTNLAQNGFAHFYDSWSDYLPGYLYILYLLGKINAGLSGVDTT